MKFSTQEEYGLRCLVAIARCESDSMTIPEVAEYEGLSQPHVAKILAVLRNLGYLISMRGQNGGYSLANQPHEIVVGKVLADLGGKIYDTGFCSRHSGVRDMCIHKGHCAIGPLWNRLQAAFDEITNAITLQDLIDQSEVVAAPIRLQTTAPSAD